MTDKHGKKIKLFMLKEKYMFQITEKYKSRFCRYKIFRTIMDTQVNQEELLVARSQRRYQEIHSRIYKIPAEQDTTCKETPFIRNI